MATHYGISPFEVLKQDVDDFALVVKAYAKRTKKKSENNGAARTPEKEQRIRVTEKTATGGWF